jgi:hypothetical protein
MAAPLMRHKVQTAATRRHEEEMGKVMASLLKRFVMCDQTANLATIEDTPRRPCFRAV